jgi:hypothetical protein
VNGQGELIADSGRELRRQRFDLLLVLEDTLVM